VRSVAKKEDEPFKREEEKKVQRPPEYENVPCKGSSPKKGGNRPGGEKGKWGRKALDTRPTGCLN